MTTPPTPSPFPARLLPEVSQAGLSVPDLAAAVGVSRQQIHGYESGKNEPRLSTLLRLAEALGVTVSSLVGEKVARFAGRVVSKPPIVIEPGMSQEGILS